MAASRQEAMLWQSRLPGEPRQWPSTMSGEIVIIEPKAVAEHRAMNNRDGVAHEPQVRQDRGTVGFVLDLPVPVQEDRFSMLHTTIAYSTPLPHPTQLHM
eukprot:6759222-Karenia_brevis.AAC.1